MAGHRAEGRHLDALRLVVDAAALDPADVALPWPVLRALRSLLRCDLVVFEGRGRDTGSSAFAQLCSRDVETCRPEPAAVGRTRSRAGPGHRLTASASYGAGRELRALCVRRGGRGFDERDEIDLRLLMPHLEGCYRRGEERRATRCVTARQAMLMELVRDGHTNGQIAHRLALSEGTVRSHLNNIYSRLGVQSRTEAVNRLFLSGGPGG